MDNKLLFVTKILILSLGLSLLIKYVGPNLAIPETNAIALFAVLFPSSLLAVLFSWRMWLDR
ncbi:MAG: hypothetical protein P5702_14780 [Limnospira sp. PMC 1291.21]|uniref:Uncharacterized protein n=3 Tax=Limnospira TaxID=2596745 RepID=A0A9P1P162_9CYAN|nr:MULTISPECIES: hypothetical protein [Limnospira]MDC0836339.1 hypothetical protein [Limnoraphis robusta]MDY7051553.1 hypothetical protein [Limnospira fusiformis LS22]QJB26322.1 hypothetical protein HFV01_11560 [Limnospira fusiformis SAG 85.79]UWU48390.1 hypothetical protein APLC1_3184 [Arthrospira platensis C1]EDZ92584.1 conserved hypothetical protein [Limnospira maxima CS-328]